MGICYCGKKGGDAMVGERLFEAALNGQLDGARLGQVLFQLAPAFPFEGPPVPRIFLMRGAQGQVAPAAAVEVVPPAVVPLAAPAVIPPPAARVSGQPIRESYVPGVGELRPVRTFFQRVKELPGL